VEIAYKEDIGHDWERFNKGEKKKIECKIGVGNKKSSKFVPSLDAFLV